MTFAFSLVVWTVIKFIQFSVVFDSMLLDTDLWLSISPLFPAESSGSFIQSLSFWLISLHMIFILTLRSFNTFLYILLEIMQVAFTDAESLNLEFFKIEDLLVNELFFRVIQFFWFFHSFLP
jgi:hypothetical protein